MGGTAGVMRLIHSVNIAGLITARTAGHREPPAVGRGAFERGCG